MIYQLVEKLLIEKETIFIQTHNFPDPDAVASAYGLQQLLKIKGIPTHIIYDGSIQRTALKNMINDLAIEIRHSNEYKMTENDKIIIVDGCKWNKNVTDLIGLEIAVIDHHPGTRPDDVELADIRPEMGACASIITSYFKELELEIPKNTATALLTGLFRDTDCLTRNVNENDIQAYTDLFKKADNYKVNSMVLNNITLDDLQFYSDVIKNLKKAGEFAFCYFEKDCNQNLLGILGDFILSLEEIKFVALFAGNNDLINISFRNEFTCISASEVMKKVVKGIGSGGGHRHMAGGIIRDKSLFFPENIFNIIKSIIIK